MSITKTNITAALATAKQYIEPYMEQLQQQMQASLTNHPDPEAPKKQQESFVTAKSIIFGADGKGGFAARLRALEGEDNLSGVLAICTKITFAEKTDSLAGILARSYLSKFYESLCEIEPEFAKSFTGEELRTQLSKPLEPGLIGKKLR